MRTVWIASLLAAALASVAAGQTGDFPDLQLSTVTMTAPGPLVLRVDPDGGGPAFTEAYDADGGRADATLTLQLLDMMGSPWGTFPAEDLWLQAGDGGLVACGGAGLPPDRAADASGVTTWSRPPRAGGHTVGGCTVYVLGSPLESTGWLPLDFVSPDLNGDLRVDIGDAGLFTLDLFGSYAGRSDLNGDGLINIVDVSIMADAIGARCP